MLRSNPLLAALIGMVVLTAACSGMVKPQYPAVPAQAKLVELKVPSCA